jgi:hypothetical protein
LSAALYRRIPRRTWLIVLPVATGAGLSVHIISGVSLILAVVVVGLAGLAGALVFLTRVNNRSVRRNIRKRVLFGILAGIIATGCYDLFRYFLVTYLDFSFWPFDIFTIFGQLLLGQNSSPLITTVAGILYHLANGIGFSIAFFLLFRRPNIFYGLAWALMLEGFMVSIYPSWLGLKALDEFLSVSILGHVIYGATLGIMAKLGKATLTDSAHLDVNWMRRSRRQRTLNES